MKPTPEQIAAVMAEMGRRSGRKPKVGRFGTLSVEQQAAVSSAGGKASAAARKLRRAHHGNPGQS